MSWTLQFSDSFTDSDGTTLPSHNAAWVNDEGIHRVNSNQCRGDSGGDTQSHISTALANDQAAEVAMQSNSDFHGPMIRYTHNGSLDWNAYHAFWNGGTVYLYKHVGSTFTELGNSAQSFSAGKVLRIEATGTGISVLVDGVSVIGPVTDSDIASGSAGIRCFGAVNWCDDFAAYDQSGVVTPTLEQHSYRWKNNDGNEAAATFRGALNTPVAIGKLTPVRNRILANATGDLPTERLKLQYRKVGWADADWRDVNLP